MDDIEQMLQGNDQSLASQAQNSQADDSSQSKSGEQQSPEEVEFNKLSGSAQERYKKAYAKIKEQQALIEKLERMNAGNNQVPPAPGSQFQNYNPNDEAAIRLLSEKGIATKEDVQRSLDEKLNMLRWEQEQIRLESKYPGVNNEPQYVREEVEDFIKSHPQYSGYAPEDVFKHKMFPDEFFNLELTRRGSKTGKSQTLKPTSRMVSQEQGLTPEYIAERTDLKKYPDALEWQEEHRQEIDKVLSQMQGE